MIMQTSQRFVVAVVCLSIGFLSSGCAGSKKGKSPKAASVSAVRPIGKVRSVDEQKQFVLIEISSGGVPAEGVELHCMRDGRSLAVIKSTGVQRRPFFVADIVKGTPGAGDEVVP